MHPRLEAELNNDEPKCLTCKFWRQNWANRNVGECGSAATMLVNNEPSRVNPPLFVTGDLSVCSAWEDK